LTNSKFFCRTFQRHRCNCRTAQLTTRWLKKRIQTNGRRRNCLRSSVTSSW